MRQQVLCGGELPPWQAFRNALEISWVRGGGSASTCCMIAGISPSVSPVISAGGSPPNEVLNYLSSKFGMTVPLNHLGAALQRHRRAGHLENRDRRWYPSS